MRTFSKLFVSSLAASTLLMSGCDMNPESTADIGSSNSKFVTLPAGADVVADSYIVTLHDENKSQVKRVAENAMRGAGVSTKNIKRTFSTALSGFVANMSRAEAEALAADPAVKSIEQNQYVQLTETWGLDRTDQRALPLDNASFAGAGDYAGNGSGVHTYIIDTGVNLTHNDFSGRTGDGYDFVDNDADATDCDGHGTHVAGTVAGSTWGLAKGATVHGVRVLDCNGSGTYANVIAGIDWVAANHISPAVANMSLGGGQSNSVDDAVNNAVAAGVVFAVAAGNSNADACGSSPAAAADALTVGSTTSSDTRSSFSNYGTCVDIFAPGSSITSAWVGNNSATNTISGTSMASPHVAGAAALYLGNNGGASPAQVANALTSNASADILSSVGNGSPNLLLYVGDQAPPPPPPPACSGSNCVDITLTLNTDNYGSETSWNIVRLSDNAIVANGSGYSNNTTYTIVTALDGGDYEFTIFDSYGDGICCTYGSGSYELSDPNNNVLAAGGSFTSSETTPFTATGGAPPANENICDDGLDNDGDGNIDCADADCAGDPICGPPPACFPIGDSCTVNDDCCSNKCKGPSGGKTCK